MKTLTDKVEACAKVMEAYGNHGGAFYIREMIQQRAELLDALNAVIDHGCMTGDDWVKEKVYDAVNGAEQ